MFDDGHLLPVPCPKCGHKSLKSVGWLKNNDSFTCEGCGLVIQFERDAFVHVLNEMTKTIGSESMMSGFVHKPSQLD